MTAEELAQLFHTKYEEIAPSFGYQTRQETAIPWSEIAEDNTNKRLMIAVAGEVLQAVQLDELHTLIRDYKAYLQEIAPFSYGSGQRARLLRERTRMTLEGEV